LLCFQLFAPWKPFLINIFEQLFKNKKNPATEYRMS